MPKQAVKVKRFRAGPCRGVKLYVSLPGKKGAVQVCEECKSVVVVGDLSVVVPVGKTGWKTVVPSR